MKRAFVIGVMCLTALTLRAENDGPKVEYVDLGVSVKWATCNLGASKPEDFGDYYAWGETEPYYDSLGDPVIWKEGKDDGYKWSSYSWCNDGEYTSLAKYNTSDKFGVVDNLTVLEEADDAVRVKVGGAGRIPTDAEWTELMENCTWTWTAQGGMDGYKVASKTNGNSIFLPTAGYRAGRSIQGDERGGHYWSSSLATEYPYNALRVYFNSDNICLRNLVRYTGASIRPVSE